MKLSFATLDVFTSTRYTGNPVAIVQVPAELKTILTQTRKQAIASEFNLSETVFLHLPPADADTDTESSSSSCTEIHIDIFTALAEVPFAGHPTVGTAHYLLNTLSLPTSTIITKAGAISVSSDPEIKAVNVQVPQDFHIHDVTYTSDLLGQPAPTVSIVRGMSFILVQLPDLATLAKASENLNGDTYNPSALDEGWREGLSGTLYFVQMGREESGREVYRTRMFGWREDPGTGSASCALGCWLAGQEGREKSRYMFVQGVEMGRRNEILVEVDAGREKGEGVQILVLSGRAVGVMEGKLEVEVNQEA
jgi:PhzF family phenazine biosynthesis protein